jgi:flagellar hook protein FlgE
MDISAIALQGLQQADAQLNKAALQVASYGSGSPNGANFVTVDLSAALVSLMSAKIDFQANPTVMQTAAQVQQNLLDVTA